MIDNEHWQAVLSRDAGHDGTFVYAVRSTGIYCRPSCPSRRPKRHQVVSYALPEAAEQAGYRACRRCRPHESQFRDPQVEMVRRACAHIDASTNGRITLAELGDEVGRSPYHLQRTFKRMMGISPSQYADARRLHRLKTQLRDGDSIAGALYEAGYGASSRLYERAPALLGMTPGTYRRGGAGVYLRYSIANCALGRILVAASERGLSFVALGDKDAEVTAALESEFPAAEIRRDDDGVGTLIAQILAHLAGREPNLDLPLDIQATAFQRQVWQALREIPLGETRTYREIANSLGKPRAARAVGRACATNPVSVVIPCHRAVRSDGGLGGYLWGLDRKRALIERERQQADTEARRA